YVNQNGSFTQSEQWTSATNSVVEAIVFGDYDNDGLDTLNLQFISNGTKKLYYLPRAPLQSILSVRWNGDPDSVAPWCCDLENGWISFYSSPSPGVLIDIRAVASRSLDFAVSNWDPTKGNYVFRNTLPPVSVENDREMPSEFRLLQTYPNPFNSSTRFEFVLQQAGHVTITIFDVLGREVQTIVNEYRPAGKHLVALYASDLPTGVFFYQMRVGSFVKTRRMVLMK
ncbi:MAG: T9SS type A sorting domain-containing protein, partial [Bacteroidota bacterium]